MANITPIWRVLLRPNRLTPGDNNDYVAEHLPAGKTLHNEELAKLIVADRTEFKYETLLSILNQRDSIVKGKLREGFPIQDNVVHIRPKVPGLWHGVNAKYNPEVNRPCVSVSETADLRESLWDIEVRVAGLQSAGAYISFVTDVATGQTNGYITPDDDIIIDGDKIKIAPEGEAGVGVFFKSITSETVYQTTHRFTQNDPKRLVVRVPPLTEDTYMLYVVTRFSHGSELVNDQRTIVYENYLYVKP
jgi:hypothetical protein